MWIVRYHCGCTAEAGLKRELLEYCGKHGGDAVEWINIGNGPEPVVEEAALPSDFEIRGQVHSLWRASLNREALNITLCLASRLRVECTDRFKAHVAKRLKALVKSGDLRHERFLPGRPFYTP